MLFREIDPFWEHESSDSLRRAKMMGVLSPIVRHEVLLSHGLCFGPVKVFLSSNATTVNISADCLFPPIEWWNLEGTVSIASNCASLTACSAIVLLKRNWRHSKIAHVNFKHEEDIGENVQKRVLQALAVLANDLTDLHLDNFYLNDGDQLPVFRHLRNLFLTGFSGPIEKWNEALNSSAEIVEICDTASFTSKSFYYLQKNNWSRLVLDNTNVTTTTLGQLRCASTLKTLSLTDCKRIDCLDAALFPELRRLLLGRTSISSGWSTGIENCTHLHLINLGGCHEVTDINALGQLKEIREIFAHETGVTNDGIAGLAECENLEKLNLGGCRSISNVNHLGKLSFLKELHLWSTKVSDNGIQGLRYCASLMELVLDDCSHITDVASLGHLPSLRWLSLIGTEVNGNGIKELIHCRSLETLALAGTRIDRPPKLWRHETVVEYLLELQ